MGHFTYAEKADVDYIYVHTNENGRAALRMYHEPLSVDEHRISERFSGSIVEFVKRVLSTSQDTKLVDQEL